MFNVGKRIATVSDKGILKTYCQNKNGIITEVCSRKDMEYVISFDGMPFSSFIIPEYSLI